MKIVEISYNPYKMITKMSINGIDVCETDTYSKFRDFIDQGTPLQTWIEPIAYLDWNGIVNEISDPSTNDEVAIVFSGRKIDFRDLKHAVTVQNSKREKRTRVKYTYEHKTVLDDKVLMKNIEEVVGELKSDKFAQLIKTRSSSGLAQKYNDLDRNYTIAKESEFYIVLAGVYSSGKSTLINTLIRHEVLPTSDNTCTSKNCKIRHDSSLQKSLSLTCYDEDGNVVVEKRVYDNDADCFAAFEEICPTGKNNENYSCVSTMEIGADLSHLYPDSVSEDSFTIVIIDTPGMDSARSSVDGINKHAEISLEAISMDSKPMIILCADAAKYEDDSIGGFMRDVVSYSKNDGGFNDRYLFLMNKSDSLSYRKNECAEEKKVGFAGYLTDSTKWNIKGDEDDLREMAENAARFVPRVFMTSALVAWAVFDHADQYPVEVLRNDSFKRGVKKGLQGFVENIEFEDENYYLSQYCDIPDYRKEEIRKEFEEAKKNEDMLRAAELQCGVASVEIAIKDYIERYAFPVKVRGLLETFEDILVDVKGFTQGVLADMSNREKELGEKSGEREEVKEKRKSVKEKIAALNAAEERIKSQNSVLDHIQFDYVELGRAISEFQKEIESDDNISFIRSNRVIKTGQKTHDQIIREIEKLIADVESVFASAIRKINNKLVQIQAKHDGQIIEIFNYLKSVIKDLEEAGVLEDGDYKFTDSVVWKMEFANLDSSKFLSDMKSSVKVGGRKEIEVTNTRKANWRKSDNLLKKFATFFMRDKIKEVVYTEGHYDLGVLRISIDDYLNDLDVRSQQMENDFKEVLENSKTKVKELILKLTGELEQYHADIAQQNKRIRDLGSSISLLQEEIRKYRLVYNWLTELEIKIKGE